MRPLTFRKKLLLGCALAVAVVAGVAFAVWPKEPKYDGKPLTYWLDRLPATMVFTNGSLVEVIRISFPSGRHRPSYEPDYAVKALGTNCLPTLLHRLQKRDTAPMRLKWTLWRWAINLHLCSGTWYWETAQVRRGQAITALIEIGDAARPILPDVMNLAKSDRDPGVRASALEVLQQLSPADYAQVTGQTNVVSAAAR